MITISVRRKGNTLSYIPQYLVSSLPSDACIISIVDEHGRRPVFKPDQTVLELTDYGIGLTGDDLRQSCEFLSANRGKNLYVHCFMGQQRSKGIVENLHLRNPSYRVMRHSADCSLATIIKH